MAEKFSIGGSRFTGNCSVNMVRTKLSEISKPALKKMYGEYSYALDPVDDTVAYESLVEKLAWAFSSGIASDLPQKLGLA